MRRPLVAEAIARAELDQALADYSPVGTTDENPRGRKFVSEKLEAERVELGRILELARELERVLLRRQALPWPEHTTVAAIAERAETILDATTLRVRRRDLLLLGHLFDIWVDLFGGKLKVTDPTPTTRTRGRSKSRTESDPTGELVDFVLIATQDLAPPINPHTIRYLVRLERPGRERQSLALSKVRERALSNLRRKRALLRWLRRNRELSKLRRRAARRARLRARRSRRTD